MCFSERHILVLFYRHQHGTYYITHLRSIKDPKLLTINIREDNSDWQGNFICELVFCLQSLVDDQICFRSFSNVDPSVLQLAFLVGSWRYLKAVLDMHIDLYLGM